MKIVIVGQGNVAVNLQLAFRRQGIQPEMVSSRTLEGLREDADLYIYAVADHALREVIERVHADERALHVHTSGTMPIEVFGADKPHAGIFYAFQSFSKEKPLEDFSNVPVFIEAHNGDDLTAIYSIAQCITHHVYEASQHDRERLHVAGVLVNNFPNILYSMAADLLRGTTIPFSALLPLIDETAQKVHILSPREAQTGPAKRGDEAVMAHHLSLLQSETDKEIYRLLSDKIRNNYNH